MLKRQGVPKDRPLLSILHVHGIDDESLPIKGGSAARDEVFYSAEETLAAWANNHGFKGEKRTEELEKKIQLSKFADKDAPYELNLCVLEGYGHRFDRVITTKVDNMIWDFFQRHGKTGGKKNK
jgi:poly(3-hydroxybutyrate) depolymerase